MRYEALRTAISQECEVKSRSSVVVSAARITEIPASEEVIEELQEEESVEQLSSSNVQLHTLHASPVVVCAVPRDNEQQQLRI